MDIAVKVSNPNLRAFEEAQKALTEATKDIIDEKNLLASSIQDTQIRKDKLEEILHDLEKEKEKLTFDNKTLLDKMEITTQDIAEKKRAAESKIKSEEENFILEKEAEQNRLAQLLDTLEAKEDKLHAEDEKLTTLSKELSVKEPDLTSRETSLLKEKESITGKETILGTKIEEVNVLKVNLSGREEGILDKEKVLNEREKNLKSKVSNFQEVLTNKTVQVEQLTKELEKREAQYKIKFKALHKMAEVLKKKETRLNDRETIFKLNTPR